MKKISEKGIGKLLGDTKTFADKLSLIANYPESDADLSVTGLKADLAAAQAANDAEAAAKQARKAAAYTRHGIFKEDADSILGILPRLGAAVKGQYGKDSQEYAVIAAYIRRMRGTRLGAPTAVSQAQTSFASMTETLSDIIQTVGQFLPVYAPKNPILTLPALVVLRDSAANASEKVNLTLGLYQQALADRNAKLDVLHSKSVRIKEVLKELYGTNSAEYKSIRGLNV